MKMGFRVSRYILCASTLFTILLSCNKAPEEDIAPTEVRSSFLMFAVANNNLSSYINSNISELKASFPSNLAKDCNLVIYLKDSEAGRLIHVTSSTNSEEVITYEDQDASDGATVRTVIDDFKRLYPAESYGILFSAHGSGWLPSAFTGSATSSSSSWCATLDYSDDDDISNHPLSHLIRPSMFDETTRAFGGDNSTYMEYYDIPNNIYDDEFDYIIFDACYMSSIELIYELRNKANWLLAAPTEILGAGMDYDNMLSRLFDETKSTSENLTLVAQDFTQKYDESTITLINLDSVESFAHSYRDILASIPDRIGSCTASNVQRYDRYSSHVLFDIVAYIEKIGGEEKAELVKAEIDKVVEYSYSSSSFLNISLSDCYGISTYIPFSYYTLLTPYYIETEWYKDITQQETDDTTN